MKIIREFQEFAVKGNMMDMAVGIIIGGAFARITTSLVNDILMPPIGLLIGGVHFEELVITIKEATEETAAVALNYGIFLQSLVNFLIIAWVLFLIVKAFNRVRAEEVAEQAGQ